MISILIGYFSDCWIVVSALLKKKTILFSAAGNHGRTSVPVKPGVTLRDALSKVSLCLYSSEPRPPGSRSEILLFSHLCYIMLQIPYFSPSQFCSPIQQQQQNRRGKKWSFLTFFCSNIFQKIVNYLSFEQLPKKFQSNDKYPIWTQNLLVESGIRN